MPRGISRRDFLIGTAAAAVLAACSGNDKKATPPTTTAPGLGPTSTRRPPALAKNPFGLGVASGDPRADSVILWARLAPNPLAEDGLGAMTAEPVDVVWEVATDDRFAKLVTRGVATAEPDAGHSLHVDASSLEPATDYYYRFTVGEYSSPVGRTRTLPAPDAAAPKFALAIANCQMLDAGRYAAYRHMADEDVDLVVHLGDYIYEFAGPRSFPKRVPENLADYRVRYASYRDDADLRAAHARFPFVATWDDHEVRNNYMGDTLPEDVPAEDVAALRAAAYRAWWEYLPTRAPAPESAEVPIYQTIDIGALARIYMLDTRQFAAVPPCRDSVSDDYGDCGARTDEDRSLLGADQERWFADATAASTATWNIVGNPVVLAGIDAGIDADAYYLDCWDGYPQARQRFLGSVAGVENPVVLTGDYHQGMVLDVHREPFFTGSDLIATEFMAPPISSVLFSQDVSPRTPHLRQQIDKHGYITVAVEPERLTTTFRVIDDVADAKAPIRTESTWEVGAGNPRATQV
jgi:alkaline phosphatase D